MRNSTRLQSFRPGTARLALVTIFFTRWMKIGERLVIKKSVMNDGIDDAAKST